MSRGPDWWQHHSLRDPASDRHGHTPTRHVVYEEEGELRGWVVYSSRGGDPSWLRVRELQGVDGTANAALYAFLFGVDLIDKIQFWNQAVDGVLPWLLADPRALKRKIEDSLWVRLVDVPTALVERAYSRDGRLILTVRDAVCPWNEGTYALEVAGRRGEVYAGGCGRSRHCSRCRRPRSRLPRREPAAEHRAQREDRGLTRSTRARGCDVCLGSPALVSRDVLARRSNARPGHPPRDRSRRDADQREETFH